MNKKKFIGIILFASGVAGFLLLGRFLEGLSYKSPCAPQPPMAKAAFAHELNVVTITFTNDGVFPACSTVVSGGMIIWVNQSTKSIEVSSDPHPIHSDNSEISDGKFVLQIATGQNKSIILTRRGTFGFHDHMRPDHVGEIFIK